MKKLLKLIDQPNLQFTTGKVGDVVKCVLEVLDEQLRPDASTHLETKGLELLLSFLPSAEEAAKLVKVYSGNHRDELKISPGEYWLLAMADEPSLKPLLEMLMFTRQGPGYLEDLKTKLSLLLTSLTELKASRHLRLVYKAVLDVANKCNQQNERSFQADKTLLKLCERKIPRDNDATSSLALGELVPCLLHWVARDYIEGKEYKALAGNSLHRELDSLKAAPMVSFEELTYVQNQILTWKKDLEIEINKDGKGATTARRSSPLVKSNSNANSDAKSNAFFREFLAHITPQVKIPSGSVMLYHIHITKSFTYASLW
jgi:hypothetical protein